MYFSNAPSFSLWHAEAYEQTHEYTVNTEDAVGGGITDGGGDHREVLEAEEHEDNGDVEADIDTNAASAPVEELS